MKFTKKFLQLIDARPIIDCPTCGARPPVAHQLGGGPHFDGDRVCGKCKIGWEIDDEPRWYDIHNDAVEKAQRRKK